MGRRLRPKSVGLELGDKISLSKGSESIMMNGQLRLRRKEGS